MTPIFDDTRFRRHPFSTTLVFDDTVALVYAQNFSLVKMMALAQ
jgi:hypothetical protein